jgi:glycogen synthase
VLMTTDAVGGVWTYSLELARVLSDEGIEVHLASMGPLPGAYQRSEARIIPGLSLHESSFKLEWMPEPWEDIARAGEWLLDLQSDIHPEIVHLNGYCHASLPWNAPTVVVAHSCVLSWWRAVKQEHAPSEWRRYGFEVAKGLRAAAAVVAPTEAMLAEIKNCYGPLSFSGVVANGRTVPALEPTFKQPQILTAGRLWDEAKNVAALQAIADELPWPVRIAGETAETATGEFIPPSPLNPTVSTITRTQTVGMNSAVPLGRLSSEDLFREMADSAIYALPARYEPFGLSVLEASLYGCTLVLGDIPSLRENWDGAAVFVDPNNRDRLRKALINLIENSADRLALARHSRGRAKRLTAERMASGYLNLYRELLKSMTTAKERMA